MELMIKEIGKSGGDIFKFAGDAMIGKKGFKKKILLLSRKRKKKY